MAAPALVMLSPGSTDPRVNQVAHELRHRLQTMRPEITVQIAFLDHCPPTGPQVVSQLVQRGRDEIVFVPLQLTSATTDSEQVEILLQRVRATHPGVAFTVSMPVGPATNLLNVLDRRLRSALSDARVLEVDGLVLVTEASGDVRGNALVARRARQWSSHHRVPVLTAVADGTGLTAAQAIGALRGQGRRHIAVGALFLAADHRYVEQADLARQFGAVAVADPLGADDEVLDLVLARYAFAAMELLHFEGELSAVATA